MTNISSKILIVYLLTQSIKKLESKTIPECVIQPDSENKHMLCKDKKFEKIPQTLPENLETLEFQTCSFGELSEKSFQRYTQLKRLIFVNGNVSNLKDVNIFNSLENICCISLDNFFLGDLSNISWPSTLIILNLTNLNLSSLSLPDSLPQLKYLNLNDNRLMYFPQIFDAASLQLITMNNNANLAIYVDDIIPFCRLKEFYADTYHSPTHTCNCERLLEWMQKHKIRHNIQSCGSTKFDASCNFDYKDVPYQRCVMRFVYSYTSTFVTLLVFLVIVGTVNFALFYFCCCAHRPRYPQPQYRRR